MAEIVTLTDARPHLGTLVAKAHHGHEVITITQHGKPVAAIISYDLLEYYQRREDEADIAEAQRIMADGTMPVPHEEVMRMFGLEPRGKD
jgi:prevent-host-death family protein